MIIRNESGGDYSSCNNDVNASTGASISPSVGIMQWRYENARRIMKEMYAKLPNDSDAKYFAEWNWNSDSPWSSSQRSRLKNYLQKNHTITKTIQDNLAKEHVANNLLSKVNKYSDKLDNPSAKVFMAEIGNTGPELINRYLKNYKGPKSNFQGFYNDFMKNSYWGPKSIYKNRLTRSYNELKNWTPKYAGKGPDEEEEDLPIVTRFDDGVAPEIPEINAGKGPETKIINKPSNIKKVLPMIGKGPEEESPIVTSFEDDIPEIPEINAGKGPETKINSKSSNIKKSLPIIGKGPADELVNKLIDNKNTISGSNSLIGGKGPIVNKPSIVSVLDNNTKKPVVSEDEPEERIINTPGFKKTEPTDIERLIKQNVVTRSELKAANSNFGMGSDIDVSKLIKTPEPESTTTVDVSADISSVDTPSQNQAMKKAIRNSSMSNSRSQELLERAVDVLSSIGVNTFETAKAVKKFNEKEISFNVVNKGQGEVSGNNNIIIPNKPAGNVNVMQQHKNDSSKKSNLNRAMAIARGIF